MDLVTRNALPRQSETMEREDQLFCWKELLDHALSGWEPADQTLERIIDQVERTS